MANSRLRVGIIGAGIGGLTAAIAIARAGADVTILEAATELGEIGAGIQVSFTTVNHDRSTAQLCRCCPMYPAS